eukprot:TRINITY_DN4698_c0_g1_i1.p1 TRINITY_DN4698_c0_g1~~TRINITY_DN4698_c0_g1_i1.p1  ORF type:complete len:437 (+),score=52.74 TRINITY_DN4698_c0_g1_i1:59-1369(+)
MMASISFLFTLSLAWLCVVAEIPASEMSALRNLYLTTNGNQWTNKAGWMSSSGPCTTSWYGVGCSGDRVTNLALPNNNLNGPINKDIGNLTAIVLLDLSRNGLTGNIPTSLGDYQLPRALFTINLSHNQLDGVIPLELAYLPVNYLDLSHNAFVGIPSNFADSLVELYISNNRIQGTISGLGNLGSLSNAHFIDISNNDILGGLPARASWSNLRQLNAGNNPRMGISTFTAFSSASQLTSLDLHKTGLSAPFPASLVTSCPNLQTLDVSQNRISGTLPSTIASYTSLRSLNVSSNLLTGLLPSQLGGPALDSFDASYNQLHGTIPASFSANTSSSYNIRCNYFCAPVPAWCANAQCSLCGVDTQSICQSSSVSLASTSSTTSSSTSSADQAASTSSVPGFTPFRTTTTTGFSFKGSGNSLRLNVGLFIVVTVILLA